MARTRLTVREAARALGISRQAVHALIQRGSLDANLTRLAPGSVRLIWVRRDSVEAYASRRGRTLVAS